MVVVKGLGQGEMGSYCLMGIEFLSGKMMIWRWMVAKVGQHCECI